MKSVTCRAPVNIAVVKYWGKREEKLILPTNSSLSVTLDKNQLSATTSVALSKTFDKDRLWINGREESVCSNPRLLQCIEGVRRVCKEQHPGASGAYEGRLHICSENNFPTAAGLASSAAGYACLVFALAQLYNIGGDISTLARQGSGSACRSVYGGFVKWERGEREDGTDSIAVQVAPSSHWPELEVLVLVVSDQKKSVSSTAGMQTSVKTSSLMAQRAEVVVPRRMKEMERAIAERDFESFGKITMQDSNQFHAICLDTYPPILYLNDTSKEIIQLVTKYNSQNEKIKVAYTFDAGPNAVLYVLSHDTPELLDLLYHSFPPSQDNRENYLRGLSSGYQPNPIAHGQSMTEVGSKEKLKYIIHTKVGDGPSVMGDSHSLLDSNGLPRLSS